MQRSCASHISFRAHPVYRAADQARLRLAAANGLLKLAASSTYYPLITPDLFVLLSQTLQDSCVEVRTIFARKLSASLARSQLPPSYMAFFVLSAIDPSKECRNAVRTGGADREFIKRPRPHCFACHDATDIKCSHILILSCLTLQSAAMLRQLILHARQQAQQSGTPQI